MKEGRIFDDCNCGRERDKRGEGEGKGERGRGGGKEGERTSKEKFTATRKLHSACSIISAAVVVSLLWGCHGEPSDYIFVSLAFVTARVTPGNSYSRLLEAFQSLVEMELVLLIKHSCMGTLDRWCLSLQKFPQLERIQGVRLRWNATLIDRVAQQDAIRQHTHTYVLTYIVH